MGYFRHLKGNCPFSSFPLVSICTNLSKEGTALKGNTQLPEIIEEIAFLLVR